MAAQTVNLSDVQGLVYSGYSNHIFAGFLFARFGADDARSRAWLATVKVTSADRGDHETDGPRIQLALSATGLEALAVPQAVRDGLPQELKLGMAARRRVLDDDPGTWTLGGDSDRLDVLVMIYGRTEDEMQTQLDGYRETLVAAGATVRADETAWRFAKREHFGFADGLSQPFIEGLYDEPHKGQQRVALGEMLLGYPNEYGKLPQGPKWDGFDLGKNGTYLVFRKLAQDVPALWGYLGARARELGCEPELLGAKLMGRWPSGASIVLAPDADDPALSDTDHVNAFAYLEHDPDGVRCPVASHVRRANPRDARGGSSADSKSVVARHRILRRGRSWGPPISIADALSGRPDGAQRGLYFIGLQASIARGFEFIQQTWLNNPGFLGLAGEPDPITGTGRCAFTVPADPLRLRMHAVPRIVTTLGGGYFMLPSKSALERIAAGPLTTRTA